MRVVINGPLVGAQPAGPAVHMTQLLRAALRLRPDLQVVLRHATVRGSERNRRSAARMDPRITSRTIAVPERALRAGQRLLRLPPERLFVGNFDVYHQLHTDADPVVPSRRLVVTLHDTVALEWPEAEGRMNPRAGRLLRRAHAVVTVSEFSRQSICSTFEVPPERVHLIPNGVDHDRFRPSEVQRRNEPPYLLYVGGGAPRKNLARIVAAFARVRADGRSPDLRLVLAGPVADSEAKLRPVAGGLPRDAMQFLGYVSDESLVDLYRGATALVYASLSEGFGMPILEAMACGTPVITSDQGATREVAGGAAVLVDPTSTDSIARGIDRVIGGSAAKAAQLRARGTSRAAGFTWSAAAGRLLAVYDAIVQRG